MKIPFSKLVVEMRIGNTTSSSIPVALQRGVLVHKNKNEKQSKILVSGFGVGLSWATSVLYVGD